MATFTAAREVEEETHRVVTASRTLPMLSFAQCHYIAHCKWVARGWSAVCNLKAQEGDFGMANRATSAQQLCTGL